MAGTGFMSRSGNGIRRRRSRPIPLPDLLDHPFLDWDWVKECGSICVDLALKHGYRFICTSNFTHPQFPGVWNDVAWHRELTNRIRDDKVNIQ